MIDLFLMSFFFDSPFLDEEEKALKYSKNNESSCSSQGQVPRQNTQKLCSHPPSKGLSIPKSEMYFITVQIEFMLI